MIIDIESQLPSPKKLKRLLAKKFRKADAKKFTDSIQRVARVVKKHEGKAVGTLFAALALELSGDPKLLEKFPPSVTKAFEPYLKALKR